MNYVERNKNRGFGQPVIKGRRLTIFSIMCYASDPEIVIADFLKEFDLSIDELKSAVAYCKGTECKEIYLPSDQYCDGCILRSVNDGWKSIKDDYDEIDGISYSKDGKSIFLGSVEELEDAEFGAVGWLMAENVDRRLTE
jgi:uncharacterized protein (DUF433 family)